MRANVGRCDDIKSELATNEHEYARMEIEPYFVNGLFVLIRAHSWPKHQSGMLPCFRGGFVSRLFFSSERARISFGRVNFGSMTSSMKPRSAAM